MSGAALCLMAWAHVLQMAQAKLVQATTPPRGFNTFDGFGTGDYTEADILNISAALRNDLLPSGFEYMVLDGGWQRQNFTSEGKRPVLGPFGHPYPSASRFPSAGSPGGVGFAPLASKVQSMGE